MNTFGSATRHGVHATLARPGLLATLYGINLAWTAWAAWIVTSPLASLLGQHPPTAWAWAVLLDDASPTLSQVGLRVGAAVCAYGLVASWPVAAALSVLAGRRWVTAMGKPAAKLFLLRSLSGTALGAMIAAWLMSARWGYAASLGFADERLVWSTQVAVGLPYLVGLGFVSALSHFAQIALIALGGSAWAAIRAAASLIGKRRASTMGIWMCKWTALLSLSAVALLARGAIQAPLAVAVVAQLAVCLKVAVAVWAWAAGMSLLRGGSDRRRSRS